MEEEHEVIKKVASDENLAELVHRRSAGLQELEQMTGGSKVPAAALAHTSPAAGAAAAAAAAPHGPG